MEMFEDRFSNMSALVVVGVVNHVHFQDRQEHLGQGWMGSVQYIADPANVEPGKRTS